MCRKLFSLIITVLFFLCQTNPVAQAASVPNFPSCTNPQGTVIANHPTGTHGIAGNVSSYEGSDIVNSLSDNNAMQCFCAISGSGIQTNWWNVSTLTQTEIDIFKKDGWIYIPNGALWGLSDAPYLAKNSDYSCNSSNNSFSNSTGGSNDQVNGISVSASNAAGQVLGLASTGNLKFILNLFALGLLFFILGSYHSKPKKNVKKSR